MAFMQPTAEFGDWLVIDGDCGGQVISLDILPEQLIRDILAGDEPDLNDIALVIQDFCESRRLFSAEIQSGWCSKLSAAGYLDQTDWQGPYETEAEALAEVCDTYDVDEDGESLN